MKLLFAFTICFTSFSLSACAQTESPADYPLKPIPFNEVELTSSFWRPRLVTQRKTLVPFAFERTQSGVAHLQAAKNYLEGKGAPGHRPHRFIDSDLYKVMEGAAYLLQLEKDPELEAKFDQLAELIEGAQEPNGYLYPSHTTKVGGKQHMMGDKPYEFVVHSHELYNVGHLYEAAIAYYRATGKDRLLKVVEKNAEHIRKVFFEGDPQYNDGKPINQAPGHQEIELALVKLYRVTGKKKYLDMARKFLEIRGITYRPEGQGVMSPTYAQQHKPVKEQSKAVGHAVRATYLYSAMADVGTLTQDPSYKEALGRIWENIVNTRMHITGGLGAVHGIEGFGPEYFLPNRDAFNETCAAVGNVFLNYRLFLLHKEARYLDVAEVALLNNVLAAVNLEGNRFFYVNPLDADGKHPFNHGTASRAPWFGTACCPSNLARLIPQVAGMTYAHDGKDLHVTFYAASKTEATLKGTKVKIEQETDYPNSGHIRLKLTPEKEVQFNLFLRIPTWLRDQFVPGSLYKYAKPNSGKVPFTLKVNGEKVPFNLERGFVKIKREWKPDDLVELNLPMIVRKNLCDERVKQNHNRIAFTRGPFVLCAEGVDNGGATQRFYFDQQTQTKDSSTQLTAFSESQKAIRVELPAKAVTAEDETESLKAKLLPYYAWNNRGESSMTVWFPTKKELAVHDPHALPKESVIKSVKASHTFKLDTEKAIGDLQEPKNSRDTHIPRWTSWPQRGKPQWVEAILKKKQTLRSIGVYWYDDAGGVQLPKEWKVEILQGGEWKPFELYVTDAYEIKKDKYNVVHPSAKIEVEGVKILMTPIESSCVGILELKLEFEP